MSRSKIVGASSVARKDVLEVLTEDIQAHRDYIQALYRNAVVVLGSGLLIIAALGAWLLGERYDESLLRTVINNELREEVKNLREEQTSILRGEIQTAKDDAIGTAQQEIIKIAELSMSEAISELNEFANDELFSAVRENIEPQLAQLQEASFSELAAAIELPAGMVAAFDLPEGCPVGWQEFEVAQGRMIVGTDGSKYRLPYVSGNPDYQVGGEEQVQLEVSQLPAHSHATTISYTDQQISGVRTATNVGANPVGEFEVPDGSWGAYQKTGNNSGSVGYFLSFMGRAEQRTATGTARSVGANQPHNNMPPYIVLYYCKKE